MSSLRIVFTIRWLGLPNGGIGLLRCFNTCRIGALALIVGLSTFVGGQAAEAAVPKAGSLSVSSSVVVAAHSVRLSGKLPPRARRAVVLQRYNMGSWAKVAAKKSTTTGSFAFLTAVPNRAGSVVRYRVYAPKTRVAGRVLRALSTPTRGIAIKAAAPSSPVPGTRANPFRVGTGFALGDWNLSLGVSDTDAWPEIAAENTFNDPPLPGWSYVTVPVTYTYVGPTHQLPYIDVDVDFLGNDSVIYNVLSGGQWCGVVPNSASDINDLYPGGTATGNNCAVVPTSAIEGGVWRIRAGFDSPERFVTIR